MNSALMKELLDLGDAFEQQHPGKDEQTVATFLTWAYGKKVEPPTPGFVLPKQYYASVPEIPTFIAEYITRAYRYLGLYVKKVYEAVPIATLHEYISLATLAERGKMTKTALLEATINEKTSGMLVIKRLIDNGFVSQTDSATDKRSRCIELTDAGWAILKTVQPTMNQTAMLLMGDLTEREQEQLAGILLKLNTFHEPLYLHQRGASLNELLDQSA